MTNKKNIMSLAMDLDMQDLLETTARKKGISKSKVIRDLVEKYVNVEEGVDTIILKIPSELKKSPEELKQWLEVRCNGIVRALTK